MTFTVRKIDKSFAGKVFEIEEECFTKPWSAETLASEMSNSLCDFYGAFSDDGCLVGYIGSQTVLGECSIFNVAVKKEYRNNRVGFSLVNSLLDELKKKNAETVFLEVRTSNLSAIGLYEKCGFVFNGIRKDYYESPKENAIIMKLSLSGENETEDPIEIWDEE